MKSAVLPICFRPRKSGALVRIGKKGDGGYLVDERDVFESEGLVGLGINDDWSFEEEFSSMKRVPVLAFDGSIGSKVFFRRFLKSAIRVHRPGLALHSIRTFFSYRSFFVGERRHISSFVGRSRPPLSLPMKEVFRMATEAGMGRVFLKIDIEGHEYRVLDELIAHADAITGLAIEFHDVDLHLSRIESFIEKFPLKIVHVHANNFAPLSDAGVPTVIEMTFSSRENAEEGVTLPHPLDMPNDPNSDEYAVVFA